MSSKYKERFRASCIEIIDRISGNKYDNSRTGDKQIYARVFRVFDLKPLKSSSKMIKAIKQMMKSNDISRSSLINCSIDIYEGDTPPEKFLFIRRPKPETNEHKLVICNLPGSKFYNTPEWRQLRYAAIVKYGNRCICCGSSPKNGRIIHVDHIKPRSIYPERALDINNLQILCEHCNIGKSNIDETNWNNR